MKVRIEIDKDIGENEIIIRCAELDGEIEQLQKIISEKMGHKQQIPFYQGEKEFYFPIRQVLFFETSENGISAHTADDVFQVRYRLYELEKILPTAFLRVSKSAILNVDEIYSITRNLTASSVVEFKNSYKKVYVSRSYYKQLKYFLEERNGIRERMEKR